VRAYVRRVYGWNVGMRVDIYLRRQREAAGCLQNRVPQSQMRLLWTVSGVGAPLPVRLFVP